MELSTSRTQPSIYIRINVDNYGRRYKNQIKGSNPCIFMMPGSKVRSRCESAAFRGLPHCVELVLTGVYWFLSIPTSSHRIRIASPGLRIDSPVQQY